MKIQECVNYLKKAACASVMLAGVLSFPPHASAKDTDIYAVNAKQNCYILMDSSGSMAWPVYEHTIDYGAMYDYFYTLNDNAAAGYDYIKDSISATAPYNNHSLRRKIYLVKGDPKVTIANGIAFTGDPGNPALAWVFDALVDTHTLVDENGNLSDDGTGLRRLTVDADGYVRLDNTLLPLGMSIKLHDLVTLYNGSVVDNGFGGLLNAPGFYFSGYEGVTAGSLDVAESGDINIYFFATGNWVNMQAVLNLTYGVNPAGAAGLNDPAWKYEQFPIAETSWSTLAKDLHEPGTLTGNYVKNTSEGAAGTVLTITQPGASKIQVHFDQFDVDGNGNVGTFTKDYVAVYDVSGNLVAKYDNDNKPEWTPIINGNTAIIKIKSNNDNTVGTGYHIDKISVGSTSGGDAYLMQSRLAVGQDAMLYVVDAFRGKMNWGFASFAPHEVGATIGPYLNPQDNDDAQRAAIATQIANVKAEGGTPLMEALQDVFEQGYYGRRTVLDDLLCRKNYVISMTDGFPSDDDDNTRISGVTFGDWDGDDWTQDPSQYTAPYPKDYYDDVAHWMYTHSWLDKSVVADPANSYVNVTTHHISFGANHPLLKDAAGESGGQFIAAYNKEQLVAAFHSLALLMSQAVSFTAPVVSVDAVNKIQSGDDLYMGLFLPMDATYWAGNLKKFKLGDGSAARPYLWMIYDQANHEAIDSAGTFLDNTATFWGDDADQNDTDNYGAADIKEDGAGEVLLEDVQGYLAAGTYWNRAIYTYKGGGMTKFDRTNITPADLGVADAATRDKLVNFTHGYTYDADAATGAPLAARSWVLGPIIHSRPVVVDYYDTSSASLSLLKRLIVVGANDGMLHVFDETTGRELLAFIPDDILPKLKNVQANLVYDTVDGHITLYRRDKNPKYLIFGERRGGGSYWSLDVHDQNPLNWTVTWKYTNAEISQTWSEVKLASVPVGITSAGQKTYKDVAIFTGGYDPDEDNFPEPFNDLDKNGTPYKATGAIDTAEWSQADATQDVYNNNSYDKYNPEINNIGRGIFIVDIDNPANVVLSGATQILPFSVTYGAADLKTGAAQTLVDMKYCFPAGSSQVVATDIYTYKFGSTFLNGIEENVLRAVYAPDIYANLFRIKLDFEVENSGTAASPNWAVTTAAWNVKKIFSANPGSTSVSGQAFAGVNNADQGRKAFYPPAISWGGAGSYFDSGNYFFSNTTFSGRDAIASVFFGTGDREHPKFTMIKNRFYAIYDDSTVSATEYNADGSFKQDVVVSTVPYTENKLLNLTCDELGRSSTLSTEAKAALNDLLTDNAVYGISPVLLENGVQEDDTKGWYIVLEDQGNCAGAVSTGSTAHDNHVGEHILSQPALFAGILYFTSYQPSASDECNPQGNGFTYSIDYTNGSAPLNLNPANGATQNVTDRYVKYLVIYGIPSGFTIITREGHVAAMASMGGSIVGGGEDSGSGVPPYEIPSSGKGLDLYYWRDSNSLQP